MIPKFHIFHGLPPLAPSYNSASWILEETSKLFTISDADFANECIHSKFYKENMVEIARMISEGGTQGMLQYASEGGGLDRSVKVQPFLGLMLLQILNLQQSSKAIKCTVPVVILIGRNTNNISFNTKQVKHNRQLTNNNPPFVWKKAIKR